MSRGDADDRFVYLSHQSLQTVQFIEIVNYLSVSLLALVVHDGSEVCAVGEMLSFLPSQVDQLHVRLLVQGVDSPPDVLNIVWCQCVISVLPVELEGADMIPDGGIRV